TQGRLAFLGEGSGTRAPRLPRAGASELARRRSEGHPAATSAKGACGARPSSGPQAAPAPPVLRGGGDPLRGGPRLRSEFGRGDPSLSLRREGSEVGVVESRRIRC